MIKFESLNFGLKNISDNQNGLSALLYPRVDFPYVDCPDMDSVTQSNTNI